MHLRKLLLRIMTWSLAAAAVVGALAILTNGSEFAWRISATTGLTAVCAAAMMAASLLLDKETGRAAGLVGMAASLVTALLSLLLIWDLDGLIPTRHSEETCWLTIAFILACVWPAMASLRGRHVSTVRIASQFGVVVTIITFVLYMIPAWYIHEYFLSGRSDECYATATATGVLGLLASLCLISINSANQSGMMKLTRVIGFAAALLTWAIALYAIWQNINEDNGILTCIVSVASLVAFANLTLLVPLSPSQRWIRVGTIVAAMITAFCIDFLALSNWNDPDEGLTRIGGAAGFVASCGSLALIIFARLNRPMANAGREYREAKEITVICPGCRSKSTLPVGESSCPDCHLRFGIRITEPRCVQCDYVIFMLTSDRCPECGTPISQPAAAGAPPPVVAG